MTHYIVTTEIKTTWLKKILRFFRISKPLEAFEIVLSSPYFKKGDILNIGSTKPISNIKIIKCINEKNL